MTRRLYTGVVTLPRGDNTGGHFGTVNAWSEARAEGTVRLSLDLSQLSDVVRDGKHLYLELPEPWGNVVAQSLAPGRHACTASSGAASPRDALRTRAP
jgi:hypothetical protein